MLVQGRVKTLLSLRVPSLLHRSVTANANAKHLIFRESPLLIRDGDLIGPQSQCLMVFLWSFPLDSTL